MEETTVNLGEVSNEVASGEETCTTTSRTERMGRGSVMSTTGGMGQGIPSLPPSSSPEFSNLSSKELAYHESTHNSIICRNDTVSDDESRGRQSAVKTRKGGRRRMVTIRARRGST